MDPAGVFSTSFTKDQALIRTRPQAVCLALFIVALFGYSLWLLHRGAGIRS